jgi:hypothetical protein
MFISVGNTVSFHFGEGFFTLHSSCPVFVATRGCDCPWELSYPLFIWPNPEILDLRGGGGGGEYFLKIFFLKKNIFKNYIYYK